MSQDDRRDGGNGEEVTWVGSQWLMDGYCGRAPVKPGPTTQAVKPQATPAADRPIAVVRTRRRRQAPVMRIGPRRVNEANEPPVVTGSETYANQGSVAETTD
jgi:hypothetical protein